MNRVLLEVAKALETGSLTDTDAALTLAFIVEKTPRDQSPNDPGVVLAIAIRRALVDLDTDGDYRDVVAILSK